MGLETRHRLTSLNPPFMTFGASITGLEGTGLTVEAHRKTARIFAVNGLTTSLYFTDNEGQGVEVAYNGQRWQIRPGKKRVFRLGSARMAVTGTATKGITSQ